MKQLIKISILLLLAFSLPSCEKPMLHGPEMTQAYNFPTISKVFIDGPCNANIQYGPTQTIELTGPEDKLPNATIEVDGTTLNVNVNDGLYSQLFLTVNITIPNLELIEATDHTRICLDGSGFPALNDLYLSISDIGYINARNLDLGQRKLIADISSSGSIQADGLAASNEINVSGAGNYEGFGMVVNSSVINAAGDGNVEVTVNNNLDANISGSGDIKFKGQPTITSTISGTGSIINAN